jgi:outer membrane receptor protein involved in Fe transport
LCVAGWIASHGLPALAGEGTRINDRGIRGRSTKTRPVETVAQGMRSILPVRADDVIPSESLSILEPTADEVKTLPPVDDSQPIRSGRIMTNEDGLMFVQQSEESAAVPQLEGSTPSSQELDIGAPPPVDQATLDATPAPTSVAEDIRGLGVTDAVGTVAPAETINTQSLDIPQLPTTTGELLQNSSTVNTRRTSPLSLDARVRGYTTQQMVGAASGINQLKTRIDIDALFSQIDPGLVSNITVVNGPYSSLYGPGFAFMIADMLETPRYACGTEFHASALFDHGTNGQPIVNRETIMAGGEDWGVIFSYGLRLGNDYSPGGDSVDFRVPSSYANWNAYLAAGVDLTRNSRLEMSYLRNETNGQELAGVIYDINNSNRDQYNLRYIIQESPDSPQRALLQYWNTRDDYSGDSTRSAKQNTFYDRFITANFSGFVNQPNLNLANSFVNGNLSTQGVRALMTLGEAEYIQTTFGTDFRRHDMSYVERHVDGDGNLANVPFGVSPFGIPSSSQEYFGLFNDWSIPVSEDLTVSAGGRLDFSRTYVDSVDEVFGGGSQPGDIFPGSYSPNEVLGMAYLLSELRLTRTLYLESGVGFGMRNPTLAELYSDSVFVPLVRYGNSIGVGNSALDPERNLQFDVGLSHRGDVVSGGIRGFHSNIDNYILYRFEGTAGNVTNDPDNRFASRVYQYDNLDRASLYGGDLYGDVKLMPGMTMFGTMTYVRGINHDPQGKGAEGLPGIYPLNGTLGLRVFEPENERWGVTGLTRLVKGQDVLADSLFELPTSGFVIFDILGYYRVNDHLRLTTAILNVGDRVYTQHGSLLIRDRNNNASFVKDPGINARFGIELTY